MVLSRAAPARQHAARTAARHHAVSAFIRPTLLALAWFVAAWGGYAILLEYVPHAARGPERAHEPLSRGLDAPHARPRDAHGRHAGHGGAAERHGVLRLDLAVRDRRRADDHPLDRRRAQRGRHPAVRHPDRPRAVGDEGDRARGDLRLRVLQVRLVVPAVQLRRDPARRDAAAGREGHRGGAGAREAHHRAVHRGAGGTSITASARSSSRSAISAGSSAPTCSWARPPRSCS